MDVGSFNSLGQGKKDNLLNIHFAHSVTSYSLLKEDKLSYWLEPLILGIW